MPNRASNVIPDIHWIEIVLPILGIHSINYQYVLDLSSEHVIFTQLANKAERVMFVNPAAGSLDTRRDYFGEDSKFTYLQSDLGTLAGVEDETVSFFISFDWLVQFDLEVVQSYLREAFRVLQPGAQGFFHYSNYDAAPTADFRLNPHARNFMSKSIFEYLALKDGFSIVHSATIPWGDIPNLDGATLLRKPLAAWR